MCSNILPGMGTREVGLRSETFFELATFGIGIASFHSEGTLQVSWLVLNRKVNSTIIIIIASLINGELRPGIGHDLKISVALTSLSDMFSVV